MFFILSKILWFLADPGNFLLIALSGGTVLLWTPWRRAGRRVIGFVSVILIAVAVLPVGAMTRQALENRIPPPAEMPDRVGGIIVLGGMIDQFVSQARGQPAIGGAVERLTEFAALARRYPDAQLVFSGGSGSLSDQTVKEADYVEPFLRSLGMDTAKIVFESESRNTVENAIFSKRIATAETDEPWILVTSAFHMPRALGVFRQAGWSVIPFPVDYATTGSMGFEPTFNVISGLGGASSALHEWLGLTFYYLTGRTNTLYPAP